MLRNTRTRKHKKSVFLNYNWNFLSQVSRLVFYDDSNNRKSWKTIVFKMKSFKENPYFAKVYVRE